jgi:TolB-like protein
MPEESQRFVRHVGAVLIVQRSADSAPEPGVAGEVVAFLRAAGADAEALEPDAVVAVFERPAVAVAAATALHVRKSADPARAGWRAGLHVRDVRMSDDVAPTVEAIDRATRLARLARAGTTAIAAEALLALGPLRDAVIEPLGTTPEGAACLVVPRLGAVDVRDRRAMLLLLGTAALGGAGTVLWMAVRRAGDPDPPQLTLGVGPFRSSGSSEANAWIAPALRDGLNTQLSELSGVDVFSDDFMDFVMTRERLTLIEMANRLGIQKMVSGTVVLVGDTVHIEARIIDVGTGKFEGAYQTSGREEEFLSLQHNLVAGVIARLDLRLSAEDERRLTSQQTTSEKALRRLLDAEQQSPVSPPAGDEPDIESDVPREPQSSPWRWPGPSVAHADEVANEITALLEEYRRATQARDVKAVAALYEEFSERQRTALERFFASVRELRVRIDRVQTAVVGEEAVVSYTRTDDFIDVETELPEHVVVRLTKRLRRIDGRWRFSATD